MAKFLEILLYVAVGVVLGASLQFYVINKYIYKDLFEPSGQGTMQTLVDSLDTSDLLPNNTGLPQNISAINITQIFQQDPVILEKVEPEYPEELKKSRTQGVVVLSVEVLEDGTVGDIRVAEPSETGEGVFEQAAIEAVKQYLYQPFIVNGIPIKIWVRQTIRFEITN